MNSIKGYEVDPAYIELSQKITPNGTINAFQSTNDEDCNWDAFLAGTPGGQYLQTSMWARVKRLEGWRPFRVVFIKDNSIVGGFQILIRSKKYLGIIGHIIKGPIIASDNPDIIEFVIENLKQVTKSNKIKALIVQPPDNRKDLSTLFEDAGFQPNYLEYVIKSATLLIDLREDLDDILKNMKRQKRQNIKSGLRKGVKVREGGKEDLSTFFKFMLETCKRQGVVPSPSNEEFLNTMRLLFAPSGHFKLFITEFRNEVVSGIIAIPFGKTVYLWKFGWSGRHADCRPNDVLFWEIFKWSKNHGYSNVDLVTISPEAANDAKNIQTRSDKTAQTSSFFKLGFGGDVVFHPDAHVYIYNPIFRWAYKNVMPSINDRPALKKKIIGRG
jgi:lipid II:glycine glycyltransferase (peptidoglycan interpeptide bridge formation enzyme)